MIGQFYIYVLIKIYFKLHNYLYFMVHKFNENHLLEEHQYILLD